MEPASGRLMTAIVFTVVSADTVNCYSMSAQHCDTISRVLHCSQQPWVTRSVVAGDPDMYPLGMMSFLVWDSNSSDIGQPSPASVLQAPLQLLLAYSSFSSTALNNAYYLLYAAEMSVGWHWRRV